MHWHRGREQRPTPSHFLLFPSCLLSRQYIPQRDYRRSTESRAFTDWETLTRDYTLTCRTRHLVCFVSPSTAQSKSNLCKKVFIPSRHHVARLTLHLKRCLLRRCFFLTDKSTAATTKTSNLQPSLKVRGGQFVGSRNNVKHRRNYLILPLIMQSTVTRYGGIFHA